MKAFDWSNPYPSVRIPLFARNVVSTSHPLAAQAGLRMLLKGGNAVDAAIAAAAAIVLVEPVSCGLGGDCFAIVWDGQQLHGLNSSGVAPAAWNVEYFKRKHGVGERAGGAASAAGTRSRCRAWWRAGPRCMKAGQAAVRATVRAGHRDRRARLRRAAGGGAQVGRRRQ